MTLKTKQKIAHTFLNQTSAVFKTQSVDFQISSMNIMKKIASNRRIKDFLGYRSNRVNTDFDSTFFERYGRQNNVVC